MKYRSTRFVILRLSVVTLLLIGLVGLSWSCSNSSENNNNNNTPPKVEAGGVLVVLPKKPEPAIARLVDPLKKYLEKLSGSAPQVVNVDAGNKDQIVAAAKNARAGVVLVVKAHELAKDVHSKGQPTSDPSSYAITVEEEGEWSNRLATKGATFVYTTGATVLARQFAIYEFLRRLGARFYHPEEEFLPANDPKQLRERAKTPTVMAHQKDNKPSPIYSPDYEVRSYSFHGSHPLEHLESFSDSKHPIREAVNVNDWIVKNRGNLFRGAGRGIATGEQRSKRVKELNDLRKVMGFSTGSGITLHNQQQGSSATVDPTNSKPPKQQIEEHVEKSLKGNPTAKTFGIHFGPTEFTVTPDKQTIDWINWAGQKALALRPDIRIEINNHITGTQPVENFDDQGCPSGTNTKSKIDYYDLSFHADKRFAVKVHTVMFYPLEGPAFVYNQKTFSHKLCLMKKASAAGRPLIYFPEGSWWLSFDNPIPVYLPVYVWARFRDIELLKPLLKARGKGTLYSHRMFNSGHEWGYWQQDYTVGLWHWNSDVSLEQAVGEIMDPLCAPKDWKSGCSARTEAIKVFMELMKHQKEFLLDRKDWKGLAGGLYAYFAGEDPADEIAAITGFEFRPVKVSFRDVSRWDKAQLKTYRNTDIKLLQQMEDAYKGWLERLNKIEPDVPKAGKPWLNEIVDGIEINMLRARQTRLLYESVMKYRETQLDNEEALKKDPNAKVTPPKDAAAELWKQSGDTLQQAESVIRRREKAYRYPAIQTHGGGDTPETAVPNGTTYPWRVHTKTHTLAYWNNRHEQVKQILEGKTGDGQSLSLTPVFAQQGSTVKLKWPNIPGLKADVNIGEKKVTTSDTEIPLPRGEAFWKVSGSLTINGRQINLSGGIARASQGAKTPPKGIKLLEPKAPLAQNVLVTLFPALLWVQTKDPKPGLAFATDLDNDGKAVFSDVNFALLKDNQPTDTFATEEFSFRMPIPDPATGQRALSIGIAEATVSGKMSNGKMVSPIILKGQLELKDLVDALIKLAGFDEKGAYQTLGSVLGFDPNKPPATQPFHAEVKIEDWKPE